MKKILIFLSISLFSVCLFAEDKPVSNDVNSPKKIAIFVVNNSGRSILDNHSKALESSISSRINNMGFAVVNHDLVLKNLNEYLKNSNSKYRAQAQDLKKNIEENFPASKLFSEASGLRIAEFIGADYIAVVSLSNFGTEKKTFDGYNTQTENIVYKLRCSYNIYEAGAGNGTVGFSVESSKSIRNTKNLTIETDDILNELFFVVSEKIAASLGDFNAQGKIVAKNNDRGDITINCYIEEMSIPEIVKKDGKYVVTSNTIPASIPVVMAEIDGIAQNVGKKINLSKGIHVLKINQRDILAVEKNINITGNPNQTLDIALNLTDEARKRWKNDMEFLESIKDRAKLSEERRIITEAEADRIRGISKMYEQSGFKVDAKELPEIHKTQGLFSN